MPYISKELVSEIITRFEFHDLGHSLVEKLQALLDQQEGEPVAWQSATKGDVSKALLYFDKDEILLPLYTHPPAPRKQITEADITEAMKEQFLKTPYHAAKKDVFLAAVNAYLGANI